MTTIFSRSGRLAIASAIASLVSVMSSAASVAVLGSSIVSIRATWSPVEDETVHSSSSAAIEEREMSSEAVLELRHLDADLGGDLLVRRRAVQLRLELRDRTLDLAGAGANRARHPVHRAELVDDRPLDPGDGVRLELHVALGVVALDGADQPEQAVRDEVVLVHVRREPAGDAAGDELHERRVREDEAVAECCVARLAIRAPECFGVVRHAERIRRVRRTPANRRARRGSRALPSRLRSPPQR